MDVFEEQKIYTPELTILCKEPTSSLFYGDMKTTTGLKMTKNRRGCCSRLFLVLEKQEKAWNWSEPEVGFGIKQVTALYIEFYVGPQF